MSTKSLAVFFENRLVGTLRRSETLEFQYANVWLQASDAFRVSIQLPLREQAYEHGAESFFYNLLPEGNVRALVAKRLGVSVDNDFELLAALGGECAGAFVVLPTGSSPGEIRETYRPIEANQLLKLARQGSVMASLAGADTKLRLSLAGVQDKLPVRIDGEQILLPENGAASTHILKFESPSFRHLPANETFTMMLAREAGVETPMVALKSVGAHSFYVVERFDRRLEHGQVRRLHQEDLCQAMGLPAARKYEKEGGPGIVGCYQQIATASANPVIDGRSLLRWCAFNAIVLNADAHAKNLSILYGPSGARLAPSYDLICTRAYPNLDRQLAMTIGGVSDPSRLRKHHWETLASAVAVSGRFLVSLVEETAERVVDGLGRVSQQFKELCGDSPALQLVAPKIRKQADRIRRQLQ